jgi:hypothetical protein
MVANTQWHSREHSMELCPVLDDNPSNMITNHLHTYLKDPESRVHYGYLQTLLLAQRKNSSKKTLFRQQFLIVEQARLNFCRYGHEVNTIQVK